MAPKRKSKPTAYVEQYKDLTGYEKSSLSEYSIRELKTLASTYKIKNYGSLTKDQLIKVISENEDYKKASPKKQEEEKVGGLERYIKQKAEGVTARGPSWYRQHVYDYLSSKESIEPKVGNLYFFTYNAKWKKQLPKWDIYPLAIMVAIPKADMFIGANLHYLKGRVREQMVQVLLNNSRRRMPLETLHTYLFDHLETFFFEVDKEDWEFIASLPLEEFVENRNGK